MISIESIEVISLLSVWMLEPRIPELLLELKEKGYMIARVKPKSLGGYSLTFIEPNVIAIKDETQILYDPGRRTLTIEGSDTGKIFQTLDEVEETLKNTGSDPRKGVLFYELRVKAKASGDKFVLSNTVKTSDLLGLDLAGVPISFVSADDDPNSTRWLHIQVRPIWTSWSDKKVRYEIILLYRDEKEKLINVLANTDSLLKEILKRISISLKT